jgi:hypothetical protein
MSGLQFHQKIILKCPPVLESQKNTQGGPESGGLDILRNYNPISGPPKSGKGTLHVGQFSTRQLQGGPECGRPEENQQENNQNFGYMREHSTQKYTSIIQIWIS